MTPVQKTCHDLPHQIADRTYFFDTNPLAAVSSEGVRTTVCYASRLDIGHQHAAASIAIDKDRFDK